MNELNDYIVWTAIISPMNSDGTIDYPTYEKLLKEQEEAGNAVVILGSTGESLNLDEAEKKQILEFAVGLDLETPLMCGVGGVNINVQSSWIEYLNTLKLDAYLLVVPLYAKPGEMGQYYWFKELLDAADRPCMIYNVPGRTSKDIELGAIERLADHPNFWAVKEASGSEEVFAAIAKAAPNAHMMSGDDLMLPAFSKLGAKGVVSVAGNVWPEETQEYAKQCLSGDFKDYALWERAIKSLFIVSNPVPAKAIMFELGDINSEVTRSPLSSEDMVDLGEVIDADKEITEWYSNQLASNE